MHSRTVPLLHCMRCMFVLSMFQDVGWCHPAAVYFPRNPREGWVAGALWLFPSFHWNLVRAVSTILLVGVPESLLASSLKFFFFLQSAVLRLCFLITLYMRAFWLCLRMGSNPLLQSGEKNFTPPALRPPFSFLRSALFTSLLWFLPCALDFAFGLLISLWRSSGGF